MTRLNRHFARHYAEMVAVMFLGMIVLGTPAEWALGAAGSGWHELHTDAPAAMLLLMAVTMTVPMVAWMRRRGHAWRPSAEMAASMIVPTLATIALLGLGLVVDIGALLGVQHVAMLAAMAGVMLARPDEYSGAHAHHAASAEATA